MSTNALIVIAAVVVAIAVFVMLAVRASRRRAIRERFGPEYDRAVAESGSSGKAEKMLDERVKRRNSLDIQELDPTQRERYAQSWQSVQTHFVDDPQGAVRDADQLVGGVMRDRGYPTEGFDQQAGDLSVDHAGVIDDYRKAHEISLRNDRNEATTDDLRQAMVHYRSLFQALLGEQPGMRASASTANHEQRLEPRAGRKEIG